MPNTNSSNVIVVTGDVTMDWNLARTRRSDSGSAAWNADDCTRAYWQRGGAALLADLIQAVVSRLKQEGKADYSLREMGAPRDQALSGDPQFHHSYAMWSLFDYDVKTARDKNKPPQAWRVQEFLGLDRCAIAASLEKDEWKRVQNDTAEADIVVLDDADLGFRDDPAFWPKALSSDRRPWVLLKMARPVARGKLWEHLRSNCADRLIVVMSVNDLRLTEVQISRELSWERTAQDLAWELVHNPRINALSRCAHVVVSFDTAGALLLSTQEEGPPGCQLFFDPAVIEGMWAQTYRGGMIGYTSCLTTGIARQLMLLLDGPGIAGGVQSGLAAMRKLHLEGYGVRGSAAPDAALAFPTDKIAAELSAELNPTATEFSVAEVQDPLIYLSKQSYDDPAAPEKQKGANSGFWTILEDRYADGLGKVAERIVERGAESALRDVPLGRFGDLLTVDRREIESFRSIRALASEYIGKHSQKRPLSIAVFGAPGSGKSFGIIQVAESLRPGQIKVIIYLTNQVSHGIIASL